MVPVAVGNIAVLTIVAIYYVWAERLRVRPVLAAARPKRVALLLWAAAQNGK